jgi:DNA-binding response OmpR family regulator
MKPKVLLAEDASDLQRCYQWGLEDEDFDVKAVSSAPELRALAPGFDALVVDARLLSTKELEGIVVVGELLRSNSISPRVPIVFISSLDLEHPWVADRLNGCGVPADRYIWLLKPFQTEFLAMKIREQLGIRGVADGA